MRLLINYWVILYEQNKKDVDDVVLQKYDEILFERSYDIIYEELTALEKKY